MDNACTRRALVTMTMLGVLLSAGFATAETPVMGPAPLGDAARTASTDSSGSVTPTQSVDPSASVLPTGTGTFGTSVLGRPLTVVTLGTGPKRMLVVGGVHGDEYGTPVAQGILGYLQRHPSALPAGVTLDVVACANPDGRHFHSRGNAHGIDLNRNFPAGNWSPSGGRAGARPGVSAGSEPETRALIALMDARHYHHVISLHSSLGLLDFDGPGGWSIARRMSRASGVRVRRLGGRAGSMGSYVPGRYGIPLVTWELARPTFSAKTRAGLLAGIR